MKPIEEQFIKRLKELLSEFDATIEAEDHYPGNLSMRPKYIKLEVCGMPDTELTERFRVELVDLIHRYELQKVAFLSSEQEDEDGDFLPIEKESLNIFI